MVHYRKRHSRWRTVRFAHVYAPSLGQLGAPEVMPEVLLIRDRKPSMREHELWRIPGGTIEGVETTGDALRREFLEETGTQVPKVLLAIQNTGGSVATRTKALLVVGLSNRRLVFDPTFKTDEILEVRYFPLDALPFNGDETGASGCKMDRVNYELLRSCFARNWQVLTFRGYHRHFETIL